MPRTIATRTSQPPPSAEPTEAQKPSSFCASGPSGAAVSAFCRTSSVMVESEVFADNSFSCFCSDSRSASRRLNSPSRLVISASVFAWAISARTRSTLACWVCIRLETSATCWVRSSAWLRRDSTSPSPANWSRVCWNAADGTFTVSCPLCGPGAGRSSGRRPVPPSAGCPPLPLTVSLAT